VIQLLIDGYNLMHALQNRGLLKAKFTSLQDQRERLLSQLHSYQSVRSVAIKIIFDASDPNSSLLYENRSRFGEVESIFSSHSESADEYIGQACAKNPGSYVVISNDKQVLRYAALNDCKSMKVDEFIPKLMRALEESASDPYTEDKDDDAPLFPKVSTRKKGRAKKLPKSERRKRHQLKNL